MFLIQITIVGFESHSGAYETIFKYSKYFFECSRVDLMVYVSFPWLTDNHVRQDYKLAASIVR